MKSRQPQLGEPGCDHLHRQCAARRVGGPALKSTGGEDPHIEQHPLGIEPALNRGRRVARQRRRHTPRFEEAADTEHRQNDSRRQATIAARNPHLRASYRLSSGSHLAGLTVEHALDCSCPVGVDGRAGPRTGAAAADARASGRTSADAVATACKRRGDRCGRGKRGTTRREAAEPVYRRARGEPRGTRRVRPGHGRVRGRQPAD